MFEKLNTMRKKALILLIVMWIVVLVMSLCLFITGFKFEYSMRRVIEVVALIPLLVMSTLHKNIYHKYVSKFRESFYRQILVENEYQLSFLEEVQISLNDVKNWGILPNVIGVFCNNGIIGSKNGISFQMCQMDISGKRRIEGPSAWFHGLYIILDLKENVRGTVHVRTPENLHMEQAGNLYSIFHLNLPKVQTKAWFDEMMSVYADNEEVVDKLLTEDRMHHLVKLHQHFRNRLWIGFVDGQMHIALNEIKTFFQPPLMSAVNEHLLERQKENIKELKLLMDEMIESH